MKAAAWIAAGGVGLVMMLSGALLIAHARIDTLDTALTSERADRRAADDAARAAQQSAQNLRAQIDRTSARLAACHDEQARVRSAGQSAQEAAEQRARQAQATADRFAAELRTATRRTGCAEALQQLDLACPIERY